MPFRSARSASATAASASATGRGAAAARRVVGEVGAEQAAAADPAGQLQARGRGVDRLLVASQHLQQVGLVVCARSTVAVGADPLASSRPARRLTTLESSPRRLGAGGNLGDQRLRLLHLGAGGAATRAACRAVVSAPARSPVRMSRPRATSGPRRAWLSPAPPQQALRMRSAARPASSVPRSGQRLAARSTSITR